MTDGELLEAILKKLEAIESKMATRDELAKLESKMATRDELAKLESKMATKDELAKLELKMATKDDIAEINRKLNAVYEQTAMLTEFRTEVNYRLDDIANTTAYLMHKDSLTEKELYTIKKRISQK